MRRAALVCWRILWISAVSVLVLVVVAFGLVRAQEYLFRHRAARLLADFQSIRLHQSTWADAQVLMRRWGAWGHYDGTCTQAECAYRITIEDAGSRWIERFRTFSDHPLVRFADRCYELLGGRQAELMMSFLVQDGAIWRDSLDLLVAVTPHEPKDDGYVIGLDVRARDSLASNFDSDHGPWIRGDEEQLARHPNYKAGRPGGCMGCVDAYVTFTPDLAPSTLRELTAFNLSCLTRLVHPCVNLPDVLPIAKRWHFYPEVEEEPAPVEKSVTAKVCDVPVYALGRDADKVIAVDVLSRGTKNDVYVYPSGDRTDEHETATVRIVSMLKGQALWPEGATIKAEPYIYNKEIPADAGEHLEPGKRYIVIPEQADRLLLDMPWCGVLEDSPEVRRELQRGFAQNDQLRDTAAAAKLGW